MQSEQIKDGYSPTAQDLIEADAVEMLRCAERLAAADDPAWVLAKPLALEAARIVLARNAGAYRKDAA